MASLRSTIIATILVATFALCLMSFLIAFVQANNPSSPVLQEPIISSANSSYFVVNNSLGSIQQNVQGVQNAVNTNQPSPVFIFLIMTTVISAPKALIGIAVGLFGTVSQLIFTYIFSANYIVLFGVIGAIFLVTVIILFLRFVRIGQD